MEDTIKLLGYLIKRVWNKDPEKKNEWVGSWPQWKWRETKHLKDWMALRRKEEGAEDLWRIGNKLYDLNSWAHQHPGGSSWITLTKGLDVTEAFEFHHLSDYPATLLSNFYVREAKSSRNSPFTFEDDGFYKVLKKKVKIFLDTHKSNRFRSGLLADALFVATMLFAVLAAAFNSYILCILSGVALCFLTICGHNFFHRKDNFRMYYFNFSLLSYRDWRLQHVMSHHSYPNSKYDLEMSLFNPYFEWIPRNDKTIFARYISWIYSPIVWALAFHGQYVERMLMDPDGIRELIPFTYPTVMVLLGGASLSQAIIMWNVLTIVGSLTFILIGIHSGHHHPDIFHDGDYARDNKDWGLYQMDAVRDRLEVMDSLPLVMLSFGDHGMHHLFPTVDHGDLDSLYPILKDMCQEFGYDLSFTTQMEQFKGQFQQLARTQPRNNIKPLKVK